MMINGLWNRRCGPGGGTRRLHQYVWGRNRIDVRNKDMSFIRHGTVVIGLKTISATLVSTRGRKGQVVAQATTLVDSVKTVSAGSFNVFNGVAQAANRMRQAA